MSNYFTEIDTPLLHAIQTQVTSRYGIDGTFKRLPFTIDNDQILEDCPALKQFLIELGLLDVLWIIRFITVAPKSSYSAHIDGPKNPPVPRTVALNIPLLNCQDSLTRFFLPKTGSVEGTQISNKRMGFDYQSFAYDDIVLEDQYALTKPTFMKIGEIHDVINFSEKPRFALTIRFNPEPNVFNKLQKSS